MKMTKREFQALERALRTSYELVSIENNELESMLSHGDEPITFKINWSCCGAQDVQSTEKFVADMNNALSVAKRLNSMQITVDYDAEETKITNREAYLDFSEAWAEGFEKGSTVAFCFFMKH